MDPFIISIIIYAIVQTSALVLSILRAPPKIVESTSLSGLATSEVILMYYYLPTRPILVALISALLASSTLLAIRQMVQIIYLRPKRRLVIPRRHVLVMAELQRRSATVIGSKYLDVVPPGVARRYPPIIERVFRGYEQVRDIYSVEVPRWFEALYAVWRRGALYSNPNEVVVVTGDAVFRVNLVERSLGGAAYRARREQRESK